MTTTTAGSPPGGGGRGDGERPWRWLAAGPGLQWAACGGCHTTAGGRVDERARRLSHEELAVAELLAAEGHLVRSLPELRRGGRHPDLAVCGSPLEVKSYLKAGERDRPPSPHSVFNKLLDGAGQSDAVVLYGRGSGLTPATVRSGLARLAAAGSAGSLSLVRAVGDGFDLAWVRRPGWAHTLDRSRPRGPRLEL